MANNPRTFPSAATDPLRDALDDTIEDSFPASDPPSSNPAPSYVSDVAFGGAASRTEGRLAKTIEEQTAKLPSDTFLWAAIGSMAVSAGLQVAGKRHASLFVGQWAPAFLLLGVYNKLVKQLGSDAYDRA
jgi:hypothetical protein